MSCIMSLRHLRRIIVFLRFGTLNRGSASTRWSVSVTNSHFSCFECLMETWEFAINFTQIGIILVPKTFISGLALSPSSFCLLHVMAELLLTLSYSCQYLPERKRFYYSFCFFGTRSSVPSLRLSVRHFSPCVSIFRQITKVCTSWVSRNVGTWQVPPAPLIHSFT